MSTSIDTTLPETAAAPAAPASLAARIKGNPRLKRLAHYLLFQPRRNRPRVWVKWLANPFFHTYGPRSLVRRARRDLIPFNAFELGADSIIEDYVTLANGMGGIHIGERTLVGIANVVIGPVRIGNDVIIAQNVVFSGLNHGYEDISQPIRNQKCSASEIVVEDEVWIGANAVITSGVRIGKHAVVAGGSVVTKDVPPYTVVAGNPARILKQYNPETATWERVK